MAADDESGRDMRVHWSKRRKEIWCHDSGCRGRCGFILFSLAEELPTCEEPIQLAAARGRKNRLSEWNLQNKIPVFIFLLFLLYLRTAALEGGVAGRAPVACPANMRFFSAGLRI
jgi:hypothetical protein